MTLTDETRAQIHALRAQGMGYREIGERLGVDKSTISRTLNPERARESGRRYRAAHRLAVSERNRQYRAQRALGEPMRSEREPPPFYRFLAEMERA